jgi:hypothetical protein
VPREQLQGDFHEDSTPTFSSPSLQLPPFPLGYQESRKDSGPGEASTAVITTFAQMARRNNKSELERVEKPTSGSIPLTGFVAFKPNSSRNRLRNKTWRPGVPIDLIQGEGLVDFHTDSSSSPVEPSALPAPPLPQPSQTRSTPFALPKLQTNIPVQREDPIQMDRPSEQQPVCNTPAAPLQRFEYTLLPMRSTVVPTLLTWS